MKTNEIPVRRNDALVVQEVDGEVLIYDLKKDKAFCLNNTSALVWRGCDGKRTITDINNWIGKHLNSQTNEEVVWLALDQLSKEDLLENQIKLENRLGELPRREAIKRIGAASLIALPVIASLATPAAAQSTSICGVACQNNNQCAGAACPNCRQIGPGSGDKTCQA
jgi:hypothetical protein